jgi:hypothetical protein
VTDVNLEGEFATPEEAALAGYSPGAEAFVVSTTLHNPWHATVVIDTVPSHPITSDVHCDMRGRWAECSSGG